MTVIVPVYLNQNNVFDLLAMLNGGIATVTSVSETESGSRSVGAEVNARFGLGQALGSLLKIDLDSKVSAEGNQSADQTRSEERVHTPASLLFQLIEELQKRNLVVGLQDAGVRSGSMVEFECVLSQSPAVATLDSVLEILKVASVFEDKPRSKGSGNKADPNKILKEQIATVADALKAGETLDLLGTIEQPAMRTVITLDKRFLTDLSMSNLLEGKFRVLGKVIRVVEAESEPISLARKSALSNTPQILGELSRALNSLSDNEIFSFPEIEFNVGGPSVHVLPIAIYV